MYSELETHLADSWSPLSFSPTGVLVDIICSGSCQSCCGEEDSICLEPFTMTECNNISWAGSRLWWWKRSALQRLTLIAIIMVLSPDGRYKVGVWNVGWLIQQACLSVSTSTWLPPAKLHGILTQKAVVRFWTTVQSHNFLCLVYSSILVCTYDLWQRSSLANPETSSCNSLRELQMPH